MTSSVVPALSSPPLTCHLSSGSAAVGGLEAPSPPAPSLDPTLKRTYNDVVRLNCSKKKRFAFFDEIQQLMNSPLLHFELYAGEASAGEVGFIFGFRATSREGRFSLTEHNDSGLSATGREDLPHQLLITSLALSSPPQLTSAALKGFKWLGTTTPPKRRLWRHAIASTRVCTARLTGSSGPPRTPRSAASRRAQVSLVRHLCGCSGRLAGVYIYRICSGAARGRGCLQKRGRGSRMIDTLTRRARASSHSDVRALGSVATRARCS